MIKNARLPLAAGPAGWAGMGVGPCIIQENPTGEQFGGGGLEGKAAYADNAPTLRFSFFGL